MFIINPLQVNNIIIWKTSMSNPTNGTFRGVAYKQDSKELIKEFDFQSKEEEDLYFKFTVEDVPKVSEDLSNGKVAFLVGHWHFSLQRLNALLEYETVFVDLCRVLKNE